MIQLDKFADALEKELNKNAFGITYAIHTDAAEYQKAIKTRVSKKRFTNGLMRVGQSSIVPTQGLVVATQNAVLELCVQLFGVESDSEVVSTHRAVLDKYAQKPVVNKMTETVTDADGNTVEKEYTVTALYSLANTGEVQVRDGVGTSITFYVNIEYAYIENGLNSNNCTFTLDGFPIPYSSAKVTKSPNVQADAFSDSGGASRSINVSFNRSFDFQLPAIKGADGLGKIIIDEILGGGLNEPHTLEVKFGDNDPTTYNVIFGATDISLAGINNAGHTISLIERAA